MKAYYNENAPKAAAWLRELIRENLIAPGDVDERSIKDVRVEDLVGYTQHHFFAGIAGWALALRLAGWPDNRPAWTGSCPCQPWSSAGKRREFADERHLWPTWFKLIRALRPDVVFGEQVANRAGLKWLDSVQDDLEACSYAIGAINLPACSVGAPHLRQRSWFVAEPDYKRRDGEHALLLSGRQDEAGPETARSAAPGDLGDPSRSGRSGRSGERGDDGAEFASTERAGGSVNGAWADAIWLPCRDGKARPAPAEPSLQPLAYGVQFRVGRLRGAGNAIVPQVAAEVIKAYMSWNEEKGSSSKWNSKRL